MVLRLDQTKVSLMVQMTETKLVWHWTVPTRVRMKMLDKRMAHKSVVMKVHMSVELKVQPTALLRVHW